MDLTTAVPSVDAVTPPPQPLVAALQQRSYARRRPAGEDADATAIQEVPEEAEELATSSEEEEEEDEENDEEESEESEEEEEEDVAEEGRVQQPPPSRVSVRASSRPLKAKAASLSVSSAEVGTSAAATGPSQPPTKRSRPASLVPAVTTASKRVDVYRWLECPVCLESPRSPPIYNCENGHIICVVCVRKVGRCPVCRTLAVKCRNLFAEGILEETLKYRKLDCRSRAHGCQFRALKPAIEVHEESCSFNQVTCMKRLLVRTEGNCQWSGCFKQLEEHLKRSRCVVFNCLQPGKSYHYNTLGDGPDNSIFNTNGLSEWRPSLLVGRTKHQEGYSALLPYLTTYRDHTKTWYMYVRAFGGRALRSNWCVRIRVFPPDTVGIKSTVDGDFSQESRSYSFFGPLNGHEDTDEEVRAAGNALMLSDGMVKTLSSGRRLLDYVVEIVRKK